MPTAAALLLPPLLLPPRPPSAWPPPHPRAPPPDGPLGAVERPAEQRQCADRSARPRRRAGGAARSHVCAPGRKATQLMTPADAQVDNARGRTRRGHAARRRRCAHRRRRPGHGERAAHFVQRNMPARRLRDLGLVGRRLDEEGLVVLAGFNIINVRRDSRVLVHAAGPSAAPSTSGGDRRLLRRPPPVRARRRTRRRASRSPLRREVGAEHERRAARMSLLVAAVVGSSNLSTAKRSSPVAVMSQPQSWWSAM